MKPILIIIILTFFSLIQSYPQVNTFRGIYPNKLSSNKLQNIYKPNIIDLKSFKTLDSRTIINEYILENGFLLIDRIVQSWYGSAWFNDGKYSCTYDGNSNLIEELSQDWVDSTWVNRQRRSNFYDGNNNQIEALYQTWINSAWVNYDNYLYIYDGNNNLTEELYQT